MPCLGLCSSILRIHHWVGEIEAKAEGAQISIEGFYWQGKDEEAQKLWLRRKNEVATELKKNNCKLYDN